MRTDEAGEQNAPMTRVIEAMLRNSKLLMRTLGELDQGVTLRLLYYKNHSDRNGEVGDKWKEERLEVRN